MDSHDEIKKAVRQKYGQIAKNQHSAETPLASSCCGGSGCGTPAVVDMSLQYGEAERGAIPEGADLGLGCGTPAAFADLEKGMTVLDLGSGAGIDCFVAANAVGSAGRVVGVDMTEAMIERAEENKKKVHASNVEFRLGEIESLPVESNTVDRVISNCVVNLVPDKRKAYGEIYRVLKTGGKFTISDIVIDGEVSEAERRDAELWSGCISGALDRREYLGIIREAGFRDVKVIAETKYDYTLASGAGVYSITVSGTRGA